jgi:hypothetical protein
MVLFVELCVDLRKGKSAKDGLYQYKNIAQNTNVGTIEVSFSPYRKFPPIILILMILPDGTQTIH